MSITGTFASGLSAGTIGWIPTVRSIGKNAEQRARMLGVIEVESRGLPNASGPGNEIGLAQIKLGSANLVGFNGSAAQLMDPQANITVLRLLLEYYEGKVGNNPAEIFSAYNCGVHVHGGIAMSACRDHQTGAFANQGYVTDVELATRHARSALGGTATEPGSAPEQPNTTLSVPSWAVLGIALLLGAAAVGILEGD